MSVRMLGPKGGGFGGGPTSIRGRKECQRGRWTPKEVDCDVPHWLGGEQTTVSKSVETFPEAQRGQYLLAVDFGHYMNDSNMQSKLYRIAKKR